MIDGVRGTRALEGSEAKKYIKVINTFHRLCEKSKFELIILPTIERVELFSRTVGNFSDIVTKQMYNFVDKKGRELVLRPEGTAGVMRHYLDKNYNDEKMYFYSSQMFRYERPQKGRYREFHQVGVETIGSSNRNIESISNIVLLGMNFMADVFNNDIEVTLKVNSIGTNEDRKKYSMKLTEYFESHKNSLSVESQNRLKSNPLRILDSVDSNDAEITRQAPKFSDFRSDDSNSDYESFKENISKIPFKEDNNLVRGLDYYNGITFEYIPKGETGSQATLGGGGQYDSLSTLINDKQVNGVGFAFGVDRIIDLMKD